MGRVYTNVHSAVSEMTYHMRDFDRLSADSTGNSMGVTQFARIDNLFG